MKWKRLFACVTGAIDEAVAAQNEYLMEENRVLRGQITGRMRLNDGERVILAEKAMALGKLLDETVTIVKPDTIRRWHRELVKRKWDFSEKRQKVGRPPIDIEIEKLIVKFAKENRSWGYDRIVEALANLGHTVSDQTVGNVLKKHGLAPASERKRGETWAEFIRKHKDVMWATDFTTSEVWSAFGLVTMHILKLTFPFGHSPLRLGAVSPTARLIHLGTRRVVLGGVTTNPNGDWMANVARNLTGWDGELEDARYLIHDPDTKYTTQFDALFEGAGTEILKLPPLSPNSNAYAERWVRSCKDECLDKMILFGEKQLRYVLREYLAHYHSERNHQGIDNVIPLPDERMKVRDGPIIKDERLGGLLSFYHREAA
jgi:putative transposase